MSEAFKSLVACFALAIVAQSAAADPQHGKDIAKRWCANCHVVESGQSNAIDHAPPFGQIARTPDFDRTKLAFLLLRPHPNMPSLSLDRTEISNLADYISSLK
ncbi:cytochrome c [Bradyrhizobium sp. 2TAF36]|uniref:cytochrome c n=1 Tax=Bradyrhizobium sp. 2TAF36 TaxID=3233016 RepID=UPI003F914755